MKHSLACIGLFALATMTACETTMSRNYATQRHTTHIWRLDQSATREAAVAFAKSNAPPQADERHLYETAIAFGSQLSGNDAVLELTSDGTYRWQGWAQTEHYLSSGNWTATKTRSGNRISLVPDRALSAGALTEEHIASWVLVVNESGSELRIMSMGYPDAIFRRVD